jgi:hypothetical protein
MESPDLSERQTGQHCACTVAATGAEFIPSGRNLLPRKSIACVAALALAFLVVSTSNWKPEPNVLFSLDPSSEQAIRQREESLAKRLYSAEAKEVKVCFLTFLGPG